MKKISTNDLIVADSDGIVVIPSDKIQEVKERYNKIVNDENLVRNGIKEGLSSYESYMKYKNFKFLFINQLSDYLNK